MKKTFLILITLLTALLPLRAQDAGSLRIYLNPGHGSWGPNDRPMPTISHPATMETGRPDTCGFYESNTNLWKTLAIGELLIANGFKSGNVVHSRTKNGPYPYVPGAPDEEQYNRNLTEICEEVEAGNFDMFLSVHSNAAAEGAIANYPLLLFRGHDDGSGAVPGSKRMCEVLWPRLMSNGIDHYTSFLTGTNIRGDIDFYHGEYTTVLSNGKAYTGYLGVLKHGVPGLLAEGYFHTYQPARHRALNEDYCRQEGVRYARAILDYFGLPQEQVGYIMGTVKDARNRISHALFSYAAGTNDQWFPVNGATVTLYRDGQPVSEYRVDDNYNGVFVFTDLEPGEYTMTCSAPNYRSKEGETQVGVTVTANETCYPKILLEPEEGYVPSIPGQTTERHERTYYAYGLQHTVSATLHTFTFNATGAAKGGAIVLTNTTDHSEMRFPLEAITEGRNTLTIAEKDLPEGTYTWSVQIESTARSEAQICFRLSSTNSGSGVAVNTNPTSSYFGQVYYSDSYATKGIHMLNADLSAAKATALFTSEFHGGNYYSPGRLAINPVNNNVFIADWLDAHGGIYYFNPSITSRLNTFFLGAREASGRIVSAGTAVGSSTSGLCFQDTEEGLRLYAFEEDIPVENGNRLCRYDIGSSRTWNKAPSATFSPASDLMLNTNVSLCAGKDGVWVSQVRGAGNNTAEVPAFIYMKNSGAVVYNSGNRLPSLNGCSGGALTVNTDHTLLAVTNGFSDIEVYRLSWNQGGTPSLSLWQTITHGNGAVAQMAFDYAGNLFVSARNGNFAIALPDEQPLVTTPGTDTFTVEDSSPVETVEKDGEHLHAHVHEGILTVTSTLQGVTRAEVYSPDGMLLSHLSLKAGRASVRVFHKGIYVVKAGRQTVKVLAE